VNIGLVALIITSIFLINPISAQQDISEWLEASEPDHDSWDLWISSGPHKPGDELRIDIDNIFLLGNFIYVLIRVDGTPEIIQEHHKSIHIVGDKNKTTADWKTQLPMDTTAQYMLGFSVEYAHETRYMVEQIVVDDLKAELWLNKTVIEPDETLKLVIKNNGLTMLSYGTMYTLEKMVDGDWEYVELEMGFPDILLIQEPGKTTTHNIKHPKLSPGRYRVGKEVFIAAESRLASRGAPRIDKLYDKVSLLEFTVENIPLINQSQMYLLITSISLVIIFVIFKKRARARVGRSIDHFIQSSQYSVS